jgi:glycosyltransferase involved in cell wall biosynthesis
MAAASGTRRIKTPAPKDFAKERHVLKKLSIVIPTFNRADRLEILLTELLKADQKALEIVVVDDGSKAPHPEILNRLQATMPQVKFVLLEINVGGGTARNIGAQNSQAEWLWFFDDDDSVSAGAIDKVLTYILRPDPKALLFLSANFVSKTHSRCVVPNGENLFFNLSRYGQTINTSCVVMRRSLFDIIDGWDDGLVGGQDTDLFLRLAEFSDADVLSDVQVTVDEHDGPRITTNPKRQMTARFQFVQRNWKRLHWIRLLRYLLTIVTFYPYLRNYIIHFRRS